MADAGIPGQCLHLDHRPLVRPPNQRFLNAPVLVSQVYLQMIDDLTMTLEPEVSRLYDTGVDWPNGYLMDFLASHLEVAIVPAAIIVVATVLEIMDTDWLGPGMALRLNAQLLVYFPLEQVYLRAARRQRRI
jgi:hypothetical protein